MHKPVVIVTGASKGIGLAVTKHLIREFGAHVIAISRSRTPELVQLDRSAPNNLEIIECDVTDEKRFSEVIIHAAHRHHGLDGLILNAGTLDPMTRIGDDTPLSQWRAHFEVNFFTLITAIREVLPFLRKSSRGGRIVFVSSGAATKGTAGWGPYNASKAAMNSLCRTLGEEEPDVTSVAIRPGMVDTDMQVKLRLIGADSMSSQDHEKFIKVHSEGKLVKPEDCGYVIAALSLKAPKSMSGAFVSWDSDECAPFRKGGDGSSGV